MKIICIISTVFLLAGSLSFAGKNKIIRIALKTGDTDRFDTPVRWVLDSKAGETELMLFEIKKRKRIPIPFQIRQEADNSVLYWQLNGHQPAGKTLVFELSRKRKTSRSIPGIFLAEKEGKYIFSMDDKKVLEYNAETVFPPEGHNEIYKRSGFIHPLYAPDGTILTNIQPADHLHHYGLWNPWTKTRLRGEEVDFWNLGKAQGTVKHSAVNVVTEGPVFAALDVLHHHIAWPESTRQVLAMSEQNITKVFRTSDGSFLIDFEFHITPHERIVLEEYRYGGFVFRGTETWNRHTSGFITSEGLNRDQADGQRARWCIVDGPSESGKVGIIMMGHPQNFNHPEPLRVWPSDANNNNGDVFINFSPTRNTDWPLEPRNTYTLRYRMIVFTGEQDTAQAEKFWNDYANPPVIKSL
jgi:hypothetical protein